MDGTSTVSGDSQPTYLLYLADLTNVIVRQIGFVFEENLGKHFIICLRGEETRVLTYGDLSLAFWFGNTRRLERIKILPTPSPIPLTLFTYIYATNTKVYLPKLAKG